ncbi:hypothetical protein HY837_03740 [archaeon]|nr:hypothetical protein [archaeon]
MLGELIDRLFGLNREKTGYEKIDYNWRSYPPPENYFRRVREVNDRELKRLFGKDFPLSPVKFNFFG